MSGNPFVVELRRLRSLIVLFGFAFGLFATMRGQGPAIASVSAPRQVVALGQNLTLSVTAPAATSFQWKRNGRALPGATVSTYTLVGAIPFRDNGWYQAVAINASGSTTSAVVFVNVTVNPAQILAWGGNFEGVTTVPPGLTDLVAIAGRAHCLALRSDGTVTAWGSNDYGQTTVPAGLANVVGIAGGSSHSLALQSDGTVIAWGDNSYGQLTLPTGLSDVVAISVGTYHSLALRADGTVVAWGYSGDGRATVPVGLSNVVEISAGYSHNAALKADGTVVAWGFDEGGATVVPAGLTNATSVEAGNAVTLVLKADGTVVVFGRPWYGVPTVPAGLTNVVDLRSGDTHVAALKSDGTLVVWGRDSYGSTIVPTGFAFGVGLAAGSSHTLALRDASRDLAPAITAHPSSQTVHVGQSVTLAVAANGGTAPLTYQWRKAGVAIPGETSTRYDVAEVFATTPGSYDVVVTNYLGTVTSHVAVLGLGAGPAPTISTQPQNLTAVAGQTATLSVTASGMGALTYQWRRNGYPLPAATTATLSIPSVSLTDEGFYDVLIDSGPGGVVSNRVQLSVVPASSPQALEIDPATRIRFEREGSGVRRVWALDDGRFYVAGYFSSVGADARPGLARFNDDGTLDSTFAPLPFRQAFHSVSAFAVQPDGKVVIGGTFSDYGSDSRSNLARLNADGTIDRTFANRGVYGSCSAVRLQSDGKILVGGWFTDFISVTSTRVARSRIMRLNADGSLDPSFNPGAGGEVIDFAVQPDGKILVAGNFTTFAGQAVNRLARLLSDGTLDPTFAIGTGASYTVFAVCVLPDGKVLVGGSFTYFNGSTVGRIVRLTATGAIDGSFASGAGFDSSVNDLVPLSGGQILVGGSFQTYQGATCQGLARLNADGSRDTSFGGIAFNVFCVAPTTRGRILFGGYGFSSADTDTASHSNVARLEADGTLDPTVNPLFLSGSLPCTAIALPGGKIMVGGQFTHANGIALPTHNLARLTAAGVLDSTFNPGSGPDYGVTAMALLPDGRVALGGSFSSVNGVSKPSLACITVDGGLDLAYPSGGWAPQLSPDALVVMPDGALVVGGSLSSSGSRQRGHIARITPQGVLDFTFDPGVTTGPFFETVALASTAAGKLYVGGPFREIAGTEREYLARLNGDGSFDATFADPGVPERPNILAVQFDQKLLAGGSFYTGNSTGYYLRRYHPDGTRDTGFDATGVGFADAISHLRALPGGKTLVGGTLANVDGRMGSSYLARLNADGTRDSTFAVYGLAELSQVVQRDDGQLVISGYGLVALTRNATAFPAVIVTQPVSQRKPSGATFTFGVAVGGTAPFVYEWQRQPAGSAGFLPLAPSATYGGTASATLIVAAATLGMSGDQFRCVVSNGIDTPVVSAAATLGIGVPPVFTSAGNATFFIGRAGGFSLVATGEPAPTFTASGLPAWAALNATTGLLAGTPPAAAGAPFTVTLTAANGIGPPVTQTFTLAVRAAHAADSNPTDGAISLAELTRLIELYNTRTGTVRTGRYVVATTATPDGYAPGPAVTAGPIPTEPHTADLDRNGRLSLTELTRVIELFQSRAGTVRTGAYHAASGTEDGFAPGP